jgi:hypothetical protein
VYRATVPKTSVDEYCDAQLRKDKVRAAEETNIAAPTDEAAAPKKLD